MSKRTLMVVVLVTSFSVPVFGTRYSFVPDWTFHTVKVTVVKGPLPDPPVGQSVAVWSSLFE